MNLLKVTNTYRVETVDEVLQLREALQNGAGELTSFSYTTKPLKDGKEVVGEYQVVKATLVFDNEKEPEAHWSVNYEED